MLHTPSTTPSRFLSSIMHVVSLSIHSFIIPIWSQWSMLLASQWKQLNAAWVFTVRKANANFAIFIVGLTGADDVQCLIITSVSYNLKYGFEQRPLSQIRYGEEVGPVTGGLQIGSTTGLIHNYPEDAILTAVHNLHAPITIWVVLQSCSIWFGCVKLSFVTFTLLMAEQIDNPTSKANEYVFLMLLPFSMRSLM